MLRDSNDNLVTGQTVTFKSSLATISTATEDAGGIYKAIFTTSKSSGTSTITVNVNVNVNGSVFSINSTTIKMTTVLRTSPNQLGSLISPSVKIPAGYDLVVF